MSHRRWVPVSAAVVTALLYARTYAGSVQNAPAVPESFIRFVDDHKGGGSLQTADVAFQNKAGAVVHLIAAIHIGEKSYYEGLNKTFQNYDAVLYELVKPKGANPPAPGEVRDPGAGGNPIGEFQRFLKTALELDFQLDDVDYTAKNFVHADLDKETFERLQQERGETFEQLMMKQLMKAFTDPPKPAAGAEAEDSMQDLMTILTKPDMERQIKVVLAKQMGQMDSTAMGLDGPDGSVIITERNKAAFKVLSDTLEAGKKNIAIFYGGAHMPDMSKRLADLGFAPVTTDWRTAWDLTIRADQPSAVEKMMNSLMNAGNDN